jgi:hypothetical protein
VGFPGKFVSVTRFIAFFVVLRGHTMGLRRKGVRLGSFRMRQVCCFIVCV